MTSKLVTIIPVTRTFIVTLDVPQTWDVDNFAEEVHDVLSEDGFDVKSVEAQDSPQEPGDDAQ